MQCQDFEKEYLQAEGILSAAASIHAKECRDCRAFVRVVSLLSASTAVPSQELERKTVSAALSCMHPQSHGWSFRFQTVLYAAAAALILLLGVLSLSDRAPVAAEPALAQVPECNPQPQENIAAVSDLDALWYVNREETRSELDDLEIQLYLYADLQ